MTRCIAGVHSQGRFGWTALMFAAFRGHDAVMQEFLRRGADANARNDAGHTALHLAAEQRNERVVRTLLHGGADVTVRDHAKKTPHDVAGVCLGRGTVTLRKETLAAQLSALGWPRPLRNA